MRSASVTDRSMLRRELRGQSAHSQSNSRRANPAVDVSDEMFSHVQECSSMFSSVRASRFDKTNPNRDATLSDRGSYRYWKAIWCGRSTHVTMSPRCLLCSDVWGWKFDPPAWDRWLVRSCS